MPFPCGLAVKHASYLWFSRERGMLARFLGLVLVFLVIPGGMLPAGELPANLPSGRADVEGRAAAPLSLQAATQAGNRGGAAKSVAEEAASTDDQTRRVRELIYWFRTYRV